jgi:hypothetical protein
MGGGGGVLLCPPHTYVQQTFVHIFKDDMNGFSSIPDICFMELRNPGQSADAE